MLLPDYVAGAPFVLRVGIGVEKTHRDGTDIPRLDRPRRGPDAGFVQFTHGFAAILHTFTDFKRRAKGLRMRKDFEALGRPQDKAQYWTADGLREAAPYIKTYDQMGDVAQIASAALKKRLRAVGDGEGQSS